MKSYMRRTKMEQLTNILWTVGTVLGIGVGLAIIYTAFCIGAFVALYKEVREEDNPRS